MTDDPHRPSLRNILALDATTCTGMGLLLVLAAGPVARLTEIPSGLLFWAGLLLLPVAAFMALVARAVPPPDWAVAVIVAANLLWVAASLILPGAGVFAPSALGWVCILAQAAGVALFSWLEWTARPAAIAKIRRRTERPRP